MSQVVEKIKILYAHPIFDRAVNEIKKMTRLHIWLSPKVFAFCWIVLILASHAPDNKNLHYGHKGWPKFWKEFILYGKCCRIHNFEYPA